MTASAMDASTTHVFVVEDNPVDVELLRVALNAQKAWSTEMVVAEDGEKAILLLRDQAANPLLRRPDLVLLDLNLPKRDGTEVLRLIRSTFALSNLAVAILSSSPSDAVQRKLTEAQITADAYFEKPGTFEDYMKFGKELHTWYENRIERRSAQ
jgi:chemotaxis family two-component system response regulator Rcp1